MAEMEADQELAMEDESLAGMARERSLSHGKNIDETSSDSSDITPTQSSKESPAPYTGESTESDKNPNDTRFIPDKLAPKRSVDVLRLPAPRPRTRKKQKQGWTDPQLKYAAVLTSSEVTATIVHIIQWANYHPHVEKVSNVLDQYPVVMTDKFIQTRPVTCGLAAKEDEATHLRHKFVIPESLLRRLEAAMEQKLAPLATLNHQAPWGLMVSLGSNLVTLHRMRTFYNIKARASKFSEDIKWFKQEWRQVQAHSVEPFSSETKTNGLSEVAKVHEALAGDVLKKFSMLSLMTELKTKSGKSVLKFYDVVAGIPRCNMLNDAVIDMAITMIVESGKGGIAFSSLTLVLQWPTPPAQWLSQTPYVVLPLNLSAKHWGVIVVEIAFPTTLRAHLYEPLHQDCYRKELKKAWNMELLPYLKKWHTDSGSKNHFPKKLLRSGSTSRLN